MEIASITLKYLELINENFNLARSELYRLNMGNKK